MVTKALNLPPKYYSLNSNVIVTYDHLWIWLWEWSGWIYRKYLLEGRGGLEEQVHEQI